MASAQDYPITTLYGQVAGYPLNGGFHNGIDYGAPEGTPVVVNGVTIGLTGSTGYVTGPHLHVGRWIGSKVTDPGIGGGFHFDSAKVTQVGSDATNGKYVRIQGDEASWVYLHLSDNSKVSVGQVLKGEIMPPPTDAQIDATINYLHWATYGKPPASVVFDSWRGLLQNNYVNGLQDIFAANDVSADALKNKSTNGFVPLGKDVYIKE